MKDYKKKIIEHITEDAKGMRYISLKDIAEEHGIHHISRQDTQDILVAVKKKLSGYKAVRVMDSPRDSLFRSLWFVDENIDNR